MRWHYDLTGAEPIIRDMPIYDSSNLDNGELLMKGTTDPDSGNDEGFSLVTAYNSTDSDCAIDAVGILTENTFESGGTTPSNNYSTTTGPNYGKVIINPFAVYLAEHSTGTSDDQAITSTSSTTLTVSSLSDDIDGYWAYFPLTQTGVQYYLRLLTASTSGSATMDSALDSTGTSSDTVVIITPANKFATSLTADAKKLSSENCQSISGGTNLRVLEAYINSDGHAMQPLRPSTHNGLGPLSNAKFYNDILCVDHLYGIQT